MDKRAYHHLLTSSITGCSNLTPTIEFSPFYSARIIRKPNFTFTYSLTTPGRRLQGLLKNVPLFERFFLQPRIPTFRISEFIFKKQYNLYGRKNLLFR